MKWIACERCGQEFPMNDTVKAVDTGEIFCQPCAEKAFHAPETSLKGIFEWQTDPTICAHCGQESDVPYQDTVSDRAVCPQCKGLFKNQPFPLWIKLSFGALLIVVIYSFGWNIRFIQAYYEVKKAYELMDQNDLEQAAATMSSAAQRVPESEDLQVLVAFTKGFALLQQDRPAEALEHLKKCENKLPTNYAVGEKILEARFRAALDMQNYDELLEVAMLVQKNHPTDSASMAILAYANACKYAETGDQDFFDRAMGFLAQTKVLDPDDPQYPIYEEQVLERLASGKQ